MTAAGVLATVHSFGHTLVLEGPVVRSFPDTPADRLPEWLTREIATYVEELAALCEPVACATCRRPSTAPVAGLSCAACDSAAGRCTGRSDAGA
jgi:hypothetical protein